MALLVDYYITHYSLFTVVVNCLATITTRLIDKPYEPRENVRAVGAPYGVAHHTSPIKNSPRGVQIKLNLNALGEVPAKTKRLFDSGDPNSLPLAPTFFLR
jgi:hypothetical protein